MKLKRQNCYTCGGYIIKCSCGESLDDSDRINEEKQVTEFLEVFECQKCKTMYKLEVSEISRRIVL